MGVLLYGHRGARGLAPENTLPSFRTAVEYGVDGVELDVHLSKDGEVIVMHDDRVDRTTNGSGYIKDLTSAEIKALDAGLKFSEKFRGTKVPLLEEVLKEFGNRILYKIEIKHSSRIYPGIEEKVLDAVERLNLLDRVQIISFDFDSLQAVKELNPQINTGIIIEGRPHWFIDVAKRLNASWVHAFSGLVYDSDDVKKLHEEGLKLGVWTINDRESITRFCNMGVDDITSDYPNLLVQLCRKAQSHHK